MQKKPEVLVLMGRLIYILIYASGQEDLAGHYATICVSFSREYLFSINGYVPRQQVKSSSRAVINLPD